MAQSALIRTLSASSNLCPRRRLCLQLQKSTLALPTRALFSTTAKASRPSTSSPATTPSSTLSTSASKVSVSIPHAAAAVAASSHQATLLPFSYDPTALSSQATKKPSCDDLSLKNSFYRRKLPEHLVSFTSPKGKQLFREMLQEGYGKGQLLSVHILGFISFLSPCLLSPVSFMPNNTLCFA